MRRRESMKKSHKIDGTTSREVVRLRATQEQIRTILNERIDMTDIILIVIDYIKYVTCWKLRYCKEKIHSRLRRCASKKKEIY